MAHAHCCISGCKTTAALVSLGQGAILSPDIMFIHAEMYGALHSFMSWGLHHIFALLPPLSLLHTEVYKHTYTESKVVMILECKR